MTVHEVVMGHVLIGQSHIESVQIYKNLRNRNLVEMVRTIILSTMFTAMVYNLVGIYGYLTFGSTVNTDFLTNYQDVDATMILGMVMIATNFILTYPLIIFCPRYVYIPWKRPQKVSDAML